MGGGYECGALRTECFMNERGYEGGATNGGGGGGDEGGAIN